MYFFSFQHIDQRHLFLYRIKKLLNLLFIFLSVRFIKLTSVALLHDLQFQIIQTLSVAVDFDLLLGEELLDFGFFWFGGGDGGFD